MTIIRPDSQQEAQQPAAQEPPASQSAQFVSGENSGALLACHTGYGATKSFSACYGDNFDPRKPRRPAVPLKERKHVNILAALLAFIVPLIIFAAVSGVLSFLTHHRSPWIAWGLVLGLLMVPAYFFRLAQAEVKKKGEGDPYAEPAWYRFMFFSMVCAWILGICFGLLNFELYMRSFHDIADLRTYVSVDPSRNRGQQMMDAGTVLFRKGTHLDLSKGMAFTSSETYCVAPITIGDAPLASYDFWAVGTNCCEGVTIQIGKGLNGHYHCGEYDNSHASAGLRLINDEQQGFFRVAVRQAQATYGFEAAHPLFFQWVQDPLAEHAARKERAHRFYMTGVFCYFPFQLFLVWTAVSSLYGKPIDA